jgi:hypothetical protein
VQPTTTPSTSTTPTSQPEITALCNSLWTQLMAQTPTDVKACLNADPAHKRVFDGICAKIGTKQLTLQAAAAQWAGYVTQHCAAPPPPSPPPAAPPPPASTPTTPPQQVPTTPPSTTPSGGPGGGPSGGEQPTEQAGFLRQVGSIVGIGLLMAVGLTYARKKGMLRKLTKRRGRR